jgi:hypothetical protein
LLNVIWADASGTFDASTGSSSSTIPLASELYVTGNLSSPCPHCVSGTCNYGQNAGGACTTAASSMTSQDCPPERAGGAFQAPLDVSLTGLTTGISSLTDSAGNFCPMQRTAGAFGIAASNAECILEVGFPAGDLTDGLPHASDLASVFCIPTTSSTMLDTVADLPGPGATSLPVNVQIVPTP